MAANNIPVLEGASGDAQFQVVVVDPYIDDDELARRRCSSLRRARKYVASHPTRTLLLLLLVAILLAVVIVGIWFISTRDRWCMVHMNGGGLPKPSPLLLVPGGSLDIHGFKLPTPGSDTVYFRLGETVVLSCPGKDNYLVVAQGNNSSDGRDVAVTCQWDGTFAIDSGSDGQNFSTFAIDGGSDGHNFSTFAIDGGSDGHNFSTLNCSRAPAHAARTTGAFCNQGNSTEIEIGFETSAGFYRILEVCFDETLLAPVYVRHDVLAQVNDSQHSVPRPGWLEDFFRGISPNWRYTRKKQAATIGMILGDVALAWKYVSRTSNYFLTRGHLAAKADMVYGTQQTATFYLVNAAPQWHTLNGGNWERIESGVRALATSMASDLTVYTGVQGIATLPDISGVQRELYLYEDNNGNHAIPVPKIFWKVVYDPQKKSGVVFLGVNNPYVNTSDVDYFVCEDVGDKVSWLRWDPHNSSRGYCYACEVEDFRKVVDILPPFTVERLLV